MTFVVRSPRTVVNFPDLSRFMDFALANARLPLTANPDFLAATFCSLPFTLIDAYSCGLLSKSPNFFACLVIQDFCPIDKSRKFQSRGISPFALSLDPTLGDFLAMKTNTAVESTLPNEDTRDASSDQTAPGPQSPAPVAPDEGPANRDGTPGQLPLTGIPSPEPEPDPDYTGGPDDAPYGLKADGTPAKKRGRPRKDEAAQAESDKQRARLRSVTPSTHKPPREAPVKVTALAVVNYQALGETAASIWFNVPTMVLGEDWLPDEKTGEPQAIAGAFRDYFRATNVKDIPPGFALTMALTIYALKRAQKPTVAQKLQGLGGWLKNKVSKLRR